MSNKTVPKLLASAFALILASSFSSATVLDLGSSGTGSVAGALFSTNSDQPTGTGVFQPFLTIQNKNEEQGYNSSTENFDTKRAPQWNHELRLSDLQVTMVGNVAYYGFKVDINEPNGGSKAGISLDALKIFTSPTLQNNTSTDALGHFNGSLGNLVFNLGNNSVKYDDKQHGSGSGDMDILVPLSLFAGASASDYIYMYQRWSGSDGGFEETARRPGAAAMVPEIPTAWPVVSVLAVVGLTQGLRRRTGQ